MTRKFLNTFIELNRDKCGDVPIVFLKKALIKAINDYENDDKSLEFIMHLCGDIRLEMIVSLYKDEKLYQFVDFFEEQDLTPKNQWNIREKVLRLKEYIINDSNVKSRILTTEAKPLK